ncbi:hypothetical protein MRX96_047267 [Rhipicephalus microplus]
MFGRLLTPSTLATIPRVFGLLGIHSSTEAARTTPPTKWPRCRQRISGRPFANVWKPVKSAAAYVPAHRQSAKLDHRFHSPRDTGIPEYSASCTTRDYHSGYSGYGASCAKWHHHTCYTEYDDSGATYDYYKCASTYTGTQTTPDDYTCDSDNNDVHSTCNYNTYGRENNEFHSACYYHTCDSDNNDIHFTCNYNMQHEEDYNNAPSRPIRTTERPVLLKSDYKNRQFRAVIDALWSKRVRHFCFLDLYREYTDRAVVTAALTVLMVFDEEKTTPTATPWPKLTCESVLQLYDPNAETELHTDASTKGLAAMLLQRKGGEWHLVYCVSKKTTDAEGNHHSSKLELTAIVWAVDRLRPLLLRISFTIVTDCQALVYRNAQRMLKPQIARWYDLIQEFTFTIKHRPGARMLHVDSLSRGAVEDPIGTFRTLLADHFEVCVTFTIADQVLVLQRGDVELREIITMLEKPQGCRNKDERRRT